jgi:heme-degrading monooxygenase HmoA
MFARKVSVRLQPDALPVFSTLMESKILPWLRTQEGFLDLIILARPDGSEVATISFWDQETHAEAYNSTGYWEVLKILAQTLDGVPYVKTFEVVSSTLHTAARESPALSPLERADLSPTVVITSGGSSSK